MAPVRVDASHFSPDTIDFIKSLRANEVRYLIVGGEAVILHGHTRLTGDVDFFYARDRDNVRRLFAALDDFWSGDVPGLSGADELAPEGTIVQFGQPPNRLDLINAIEAVAFDEAWEGRLEAVVAVGDEEIPLPYIGRAALIKNKQATGRPTRSGRPEPSDQATVSTPLNRPSAQVVGIEKRSP